VIIYGENEKKIPTVCFCVHSVSDLAHVVHDSVAVMHLSHVGHEPRVEEHPLGRGRLAGVDVSKDANVANTGARFTNY
jgi:hypothetical protein